MKPVLIIGGGLTGLTLAQTLQKRGIPYKVYERDASSDSRAQGYRIRLNRLGIESLNELVPAEIFRRIIREAALWYPGLVRLDPTTGRQQGPVIDLPDGPEMPPVDLADPFAHECMQARLPVDRKRYRDALAQNVDVTWGKALARWEISDDGLVAHFDDGTASPSGSLLVGCDGSHSRVAQLLGMSPAPKRIGGGMIYGKAPLTPELEDELLPATKYAIRIALEPSGAGNLFIETCYYRDENCIKDYVLFVLSDQDAFAEFAGKDQDLASWPASKLGELAARHARERGYHPVFQAIFKHVDPNMVTYRPNVMTMPDDFPTWKSNRRVTVLGDAVHAVPPTGGSTKEGSAAGWSAEAIEGWEEKAREDDITQTKTVHAALTGSWPMIFWKGAFWDGKELDLP